MTISSLYKNLSSKYNSIIKIDKSEISNYTKNYDTLNNPIQIREYIIVVVSALIFLGYLPIICTYFYSLVIFWEANLLDLLNLNTAFNNNPQFLMSILLILFAIPTYTFLMPNKSLLDLLFILIPSKLKVRIKKYLNRFRLFRKPIILLNRKNKIFIIFTILLFYIELFLIVILLHSYTVPILLTKIITYIWITLPLLCVIIFPLLIIVPFFQFVFRFLKKSDSEDYYINSKIIYQLLLVIKKLDSIKNVKIASMVEKDSILMALNTISKYIKKIHNPINYNDSWAISKIEQISSSIFSLSYLVYFPSKDSHKILIDSLINYLNIFLLGEYDSLPLEPISKLQGSSLDKKFKFRNVKTIISAGVFLVIPIIILFLIVSLTDIVIEPQLFGFLKILYLSWLIICIIYFLEKFSPDYKNFLIDTLRILFHK